MCTLRHRLHDDGGVDVPPPDQVVVGPGGVEEVAPQHVEEETEQERGEFPGHCEIILDNNIDVSA